MPFHGLIEVDNNEVYRFLGTSPFLVRPLVQNRVVVEPWRTIYNFSTPKNTLELIVMFSQPTVVEDPYTYITFNVRSLDQNTHHVRIYFDEGPFLGINDKGENVYWSRTDSDLTVLTMYHYDQIPFNVRGDDTRNNWGYAHLISGNKSITTGYQAFGEDLRQAFSTHKPMPSDDTRKPRQANDQAPTSAFILNIGPVSLQTISSYIVFLYDDVYSMLYFEESQVPYWRTELNNNVTLLVNEAVGHYESNMVSITSANQDLMTLLTNVGGEQYQVLGSLVTRQVTGALSQTWSPKYNRSSFYMKEISSDGDVNTVDVIFPASPFFLLLAPDVLRDLLIPLLAYGNNETTIHYNLAWAPHHL